MIYVNIHSGLAGITNFIPLVIYTLWTAVLGQNVFNLQWHIAQEPFSIYVILNFYLETIKATWISRIVLGLPWWRTGWESACQCRGHRFEPWSGKIPHAAEQLDPWATTTEPVRLEPVLCNKRGRTNPRRESFSQWTCTIPDSLAKWREMPGVEAKGLWVYWTLWSFIRDWYMAILALYLDP